MMERLVWPARHGESTNFSDYDQESLLTFPHLPWERAEMSHSPPVESHTSAREGGLTASIGVSHTGRGSESHLLSCLNPTGACCSEQIQEEDD